MRALIVTSPAARSALAGARGLADAGWRVDVAAPARAPVLAASRAVATTHVVPWPEDGLAPFGERVARVARACGSAVVLAAGDDWMMGLAAVRDVVPASVAHPGRPQVDRLLDKLQLAGLADAVGLPSPATRRASEAALANVRGPVVVKARQHWLPGHTGTGGRLEAGLADSEAQARDLSEAMRAAGGDPLLQAQVEGALMAVSGVTDGVDVTGVVQQVALATWPEPIGVSCRAVTVAPEPWLVDRIRDLLGELGWWGVFEAQFLVPEGGMPHLIDLNGRLYGSISLAVAAGANLPAASASMAIDGVLPEVPSGRPGVRYLWVEGELRRLLARRGRTGGTAWIDPPARRGWHPSVVRLRDPGPGLVHAADLGRRALRQLGRRTTP